MDRRYDLILYGATGFTGRQGVDWLSKNAPEGLEWAAAGRNEEKLRALDVPYVVADSTRPQTVDEMAAQTRALITTAGPFALYGDPVVAACVRHGTHYADITGETPWVRRLIDRHHEDAFAEGTHIVPFCGFDSVPSDLGAWFLVRALQERGATKPIQIHSVFTIKGGFNGGTLASAINMGENFPAKEMANPYLLNPDPKIDRETWKDHADPKAPVFVKDLGIWTAPFVMGAINTRVVRRTEALLADYGTGFRYQETMGLGRKSTRAKAQAVTLGLGGFAAAVASPLGRKLLKKLGPDPGEGPSEEEMDGGYTRVDYVGRSGDLVLKARMEIDGDPGNRATLRLLCEAGLILATQPLEGGGVLTPVASMGERLLEALRKREGFSLELQ